MMNVETEPSFRVTSAPIKTDVPLLKNNLSSAMSIEPLPLRTGERTEESATFPSNLDAPNDTSLNASSIEAIINAGLVA